MVMISVLVLLGLGLVTATVLAVASRVFHVEEDPRVQAVLEVLPGANCGGCGYAGCEGYASAVATDPAVPANRCCAGGAETSVAVGELTGKTVAASEPLLSFRRCDKVAGNVALRYDYQGMPSCAAAAGLVGGSDSCSYSCLGFGDCVQVCPFDAVEIRGGVARVSASRCTGCGKCVEACPRTVLELIPARARVMVVCSTKDKLKAVTEVCRVGCIKCGRCVKSCPAGAVTLENDRIHINHKVCLTYGPECGEACAAACARKSLRVLRPGGLPKIEPSADATCAPGKPLNAAPNIPAAPQGAPKASEPEKPQAAASERPQAPAPGKETAPQAPEKPQAAPSAAPVRLQAPASEKPSAPAGSPAEAASANTVSAAKEKA